MDTAVVDLLLEGLRLMVVGLTGVFAFLLLLVGSLFALSGLAVHLDSKPPPSGGPRQGVGEGVAPEARDPHLAALITAAIATYRQRHRR